MNPDRITWAVQRLILINAAIFAVQLLLNIPFGGASGGGLGFAPPGGDLMKWLAFQPSAFVKGCIWKPVTYMFLHNSLMHLFFNMLWLFFFGPDVERTLGTRQFIRFYLLCGALGVQATFLPLVIAGIDVSVTGASGAAMAVMVAFAMSNPERRFYLFPLPVPISAWALVIMVVAMNIVTALQGGGSTSVMTHFGGMAAGFAYMTILPRIRMQQRTLWRNAWARKKSGRDTLGEAVDNIFKFEDKKRPRN